MSQPSPLSAVRNRALALRAGGDLAGARQLLADTVEAARPRLGEDHQDLLGTAHLLARLHREADDPTGARRVLEEAFAAGERRWGHADPLMVAIAFDLASVAEELGNRHEARRNYQRVATSGPGVLGDDHPAVRTARAYLGLATTAPASPGREEPTVAMPPVPTPASPTSPSRLRSASRGRHRPRLPRRPGHRTKRPHRVPPGNPGHRLPARLSSTRRDRPPRRPYRRLENPPAGSSPARAVPRRLRFHHRCPRLRHLPLRSSRRPTHQRQTPGRHPVGHPGT
ncbi:tetratricopeptide repeat protein [Micromonospora echinospora]|uniref:tetratricopeptide repeat protein n=1 Tax=Micromonospora echinospora TaxID=1877 RepID=UPI003A8A7559